MYGLIVRFTCTDNDAAVAFDTLIERLVPEIEANETGTRIYAAHRVTGKPLQRIFYELYDDRQAFRAHEASPHVMAFLGQRAAHLAEVEVDEVDLLALAQAAV